jgi:Zn-dependent protease with chaperone function
LITARFFDGRVSQPVPCGLRLIPATRGAVALQLHSLAPAGPATTPSTPWREFTASQIEWPDAGETRIAVIRFADGSQAQTLEPQRLSAALRSAGYRAPGLHALASKMASHRGALLAGVVACAAISAGVWLYGVPALSKVITHFMPTRWETQLADSTLDVLDKAWLKPSKLGADRQAQITADFDALVKKAAPDGSAPRYRLLFRSMGSLLGQGEKGEKGEKPGEGKTGNTGDTGGGGNAFALPGGVLVMTDELVAVAEPGAVLGVLAHELGHVKNRHATRMAVESSLLGTAIALISGDPTSVMATVPVALASLSFSRSHETEADCYALQMLARAGQSTEPLAQLLETISKGQRDQRGAGSGMAGVLSSHPSTPERVQLLRDPAAVKQACGG